MPRSTTGFAISLAGGAVVYRYKTQTVAVLSSTEAEFFAAPAAAAVAVAVAATADAKHVLYIRSLLQDLSSYFLFRTFKILNTQKRTKSCHTA